MINDYGKYKKNRRPPHPNKGRRWLILGFLLIAVLVYGYYKKSVSFAELKQTTVEKITHFFHRSSAQKVVKPVVKKETAPLNTAELKPIHFDFYDELPKVAVRPSAPPVMDQFHEVNRIDKIADKKEIMLSSAEKTSPPATPAISGMKKNFSAQSIEDDLSADLSMMKAVNPVVATATPYILQIGIFHNLEAATRYQKALAVAGLKVEVVKIRQGSEAVYRLQQGPYRNEEQLKLAKKRLTARGVTCEVQKLSPSV